MLNNLLHNAVKFSHRDDTIAVTVDRTPDGDPRLVVEDDGDGMDETTLRRLFESFSQGRTQPDRGGLGLGLALAKALVELHGGDITAVSPGPGLGSKFTIHLPAADAPEPVMDSEEEKSPDNRRCKIVIIDDRRDASYPLQRMLELLGHEVHVAEDAENGIELALRTQPNLVLCDIGLPGILTGLDVARKLRAVPELRETHLVAVTGYGQEEDRRDSASAGFHRHITKPVSLNGLHEIIASIPCGTPAA
ncbi:MAG: ATP-binding protein [Pirellulales bacterium]